MERFLACSLAGVVAVLGAGCDNNVYNCGSTDDCVDCHQTCQSRSCERVCVNGDCETTCSDDGWNWWDDDDNTLPPQCATSTDCRAGQLCDPLSQCVDVVADCPLTDECLPDPPGHVGGVYSGDNSLSGTPATGSDDDWLGDDPTYVGGIEGDGFTGRVGFDVDFYPDHLYGRGIVTLRQDRTASTEVVHVTITGMREGADLRGQVIETGARDRTFDAVFQGTMESASVIRGTFQVSSDDGNMAGTFLLTRTSPCGCATNTPAGCRVNADCGAGESCVDGSCVTDTTDECRRNADCPNGRLCVDARCVECFRDSDCGAGFTCQQNACVPTCPGECCADADCGEGFTCQQNACVPVCSAACCADSDCGDGQVCRDGTCRNTCIVRCQCQEGEVCEDGVCQPPTEPPPVACDNDCQCDYQGGFRCIQGTCQLPTP